MAITAAIAVIGAFSLAYSFDALPDISAQSISNEVKSSALMTGHVTLTGHDDQGNVIAYRQTDNVVVNNGDDCIAKLIFTSATGGNCASASTFDFVHIGTGSNSATEGVSALVAYAKQTTADTWATTAASATAGAATLITANFFNVGATITEASIQDASATDSDVLAIQSFSAIPLGTSDDLTIQWTVTIDGN